jgi:hypothetical protein
MKRMLVIAATVIAPQFSLNAQTAPKQKVKYDTVIVKHVYQPATKTKKTAEKAVDKPAPVLPVPEYINQPYYYDKDDNKLIGLENATARLTIKKKTLGLKGAKQSLTMESPSAKIRFTAKKDIVFFIKTSGDVIDLTSYIRLYQFVPVEQKREVTINTKEGLLTDRDDARGKSISFAVKMLSKDNYVIQLPDQLEAGEYGFVWMKNMEVKEFVVSGFGVDWKSSD